MWDEQSRHCQAAPVLQDAAKILRIQPGNIAGVAPQPSVYNSIHGPVTECSGAHNDRRQYGASITLNSKHLRENSKVDIAVLLLLHCMAAAKLIDMTRTGEIENERMFAHQAARGKKRRLEALVRWRNLGSDSRLREITPW